MAMWVVQAHREGRWAAWGPQGLDLVIQRSGMGAVSIQRGALSTLSWYDLPSFLSCLFPPLSVPHPISVTFQLHLTLSACLLPPLLQLRGVLVQLCYICAQTSLRLPSDLLGPDSCAKGYHLYTSYNFSYPFFIINNG